MGALAWDLINIPDFTPGTLPILSPLNQQHICILGRGGGSQDYKDGVILDANTGAGVRRIEPASDITFTCEGQSYIQKPNKLVSLVINRKTEVYLVCYNQTDDSISTIRNYGEWFNEDDY